jgi:hypothetical protein
MKWTDMTVAIVAMILLVICLFGMGFCVHEASKMKLECMRAGKTEAECRNL